MRNAGLGEPQGGIKIAGRNINNLRYRDNANHSNLRAGSSEKLKSLLISMKEESENTGLKLSIQRTKIMESFMANRWGKSGNNYRFYFLGVQHPLQIATTATKLKDSSSLGEKLWTNLLLLLSRFSHVRLCATP